MSKYLNIQFVRKGTNTGFAPNINQYNWSLPKIALLRFKKHLTWYIKDILKTVWGSNYQTNEKIFSLS